MDKSAVMNHRQTVQNRGQKPHTFPIPQHAVAQEVIFQRNPLHKVHHNISGLVLVKSVPDADNGRYGVQLQKSLYSIRPAYLSLVCKIPLDLIGIAVGTCGGSSGKILLHRHLHFQCHIPAHVSDAESTPADDISDQIAAGENGILFQGVGGLAAAVLIIAADRAKAVALQHLFHTFHTTSHLHTDSSKLFYASLIHAIPVTGPPAGSNCFRRSTTNMSATAPRSFVS